jgi:hypothetical protein
LASNTAPSTAKQPPAESRDGLDASVVAKAAGLSLLAWLIPGAGHIALGKRLRGLTFTALVAVAVVVGCYLDGDLTRIQADQPLSTLRTIGCMGMGTPYFALRFGAGYTGAVLAPGYEYGSAFILLAGLMNLLLVLDTWDIATGNKE